MARSAKTTPKTGKRQAAAEAKRAAFLERAGDFLKRCEPYLDRDKGYIRSLYESAHRNCSLTELEAFSLETAMKQIDKKDAESR